MNIDYKAMRTALRLRQTEMGATLGVTRVSIGRWEKDPERAPQWYWYALMGMMLVHRLEGEAAKFYYVDD